MQTKVGDMIDDVTEKEEIRRKVRLEGHLKIYGELREKIEMKVCFNDSMDAAKN